MIIRMVFDLPFDTSHESPEYGHLTLSGRDTVEVHLPEGTTGTTIPSVEMPPKDGWKCRKMLGQWGRIDYINGVIVEESDTLLHQARAMEEIGQDATELHREAAELKAQKL